MNKEKRSVPKLRFPGFTEDWEQRKLGDYLSIPEKEILEVASSDDLITVKLNLGGVELGASRDTLSLGSTVYYKRYAGQFIYGKQNFFNGSMGLIPTNLDGKGSSGDVPSFNVSNIEENYLYTYVSRESYWRSKEAAASGTGSKRIHEKTFLDFNIDVPSMEEQKLISNTFDLIDRFITLHQRKLEYLNLKKKALLQKLFPKNGERYPELRFPGFTDAWEQRKLIDTAKTFIGLVTTMTENYRDSGTLLIRNSDIKEGQFVFSEKPIHLDEEFAENISETNKKYWKTKAGNLYTVVDVLSLSGGYWYNEEILKKSGVNKLPSTWDEFISMCTQINNRAEKESTEVKPLKSSAEGYLYFMDHMLLNRTEDINEVVYDDFVGALKKMESIYQFSTFENMSYSYRDETELFNEGRLAIYVNGVWAAPMISENIHAKYALLPTDDGISMSCESASLGYVLGKSGSREREDASVRFLKYMLSKKVQIQILEQTEQFPANPNISLEKYKDEKKRMYQAAKTVLDANRKIEIPDNVWSASQKEYFTDNIFRVFTNDMGKQEFVDNIEKRIR